MCGIVLSARWATSQDPTSHEFLSFESLQQKLHAANALRGPDAQRTHRVTVEEHGGHRVDVEFFASELRLRGDEPVVQPHVDEETGMVLCWNGEIFQGLNISMHENDGVKLVAELKLAQIADDIVCLFGKLEGPYAFVYYEPVSQQLFFARDPLGRRSLLVHKPAAKQPYFLLASVSAGSHEGYDLTEVLTDHIYALNLRMLSAATDPTAQYESCIKAYPRKRSPAFSVELPFAEPSKINPELPSAQPELPRLKSLDHIPSHLACAVDDFITHLNQSVMRHIQNIPSRHRPNLPRAAQYTKPARLAVLFSGGIDSTMLAYLADRHVPAEEPIDLLNVAFENPRKIQLKVNGNVGGLKKKQKKLKERNGVLGVVESGGYNDGYLVPDRVTGLQELEELRRLCPRRFWNFVEVDVPYLECQAARLVVESVMWPSRTVMDLSLAIALFFAAQGKGQVRSNSEAPPEPYTSPARVLLNGLGSDELLGGYGRHRTAYSTGGWAAVIDEFQLEIDRIPTRNLGRDDRIISSHGKETRHPFLDLNVVSFLAQLPVHYKMDPRLEVGLGDKLLLRLAARKVRLVQASARKKRAMQFGSHSARMEAGVGDGGGQLTLAS